MTHTDFIWQERTGRDPQGEAFHEWTYDHASGRILASIQGPQDQKGGFTHTVQFLFFRHVMMEGGPFIFGDFDSAKRFIETAVSHRVESLSPEGELTVVSEPNENVVIMTEALERLKSLVPTLQQGTILPPGFPLVVPAMPMPEPTPERVDAEFTER